MITLVELEEFMEETAVVYC